jgi:hypothetical protein
MPTTWVPDEVWTQLDSRQARLSKPARRALAAVVAVAAVATTLIALGVTSGELGGNLYVPTWSTHVETRAHDFVETVDITNDGWFAETIIGASNRDRHIDLTEIRPARLTIPHGKTRTLHLRFHVTDCAAVAPGDNPPVIKLDRFWGTQRVTLEVHGWTDGPQPGGPAQQACGRGD